MNFGLSDPLSAAITFNPAVHSRQSLLSLASPQSFYARGASSQSFYAHGASPQSSYGAHGASPQSSYGARGKLQRSFATYRHFVGRCSAAKPIIFNINDH